MCMKYLVNREDLGKRVTGYIFYDGDSKGFIGLTEKQIKDTLGKGERLYGLVLNADGEISMDKDGWHTNNYMVRSGINSLTPAVEADCAANIFYVVVGARKEQNEIIYEAVNSRYARVELPEGKVKMLCEFGCIQGGVYMDGDKLKACDGVVVAENLKVAQNKPQGVSKGKNGGDV